MTNTPDTIRPEFIRYARKAAEGFLRSWDYYGERFAPAAAIGGPATPAYYANMLAKAVHMLDDHDALKAAKSDAFTIWPAYAQAHLDPRSGQPGGQVWGPDAFAQTLADAKRIGR